MNDLSLYIIAALLPLSAGLVILQVNPYHALVIRGILGAVAALVYAIFGAADVALTEALVGTMLAITLYAVAVRSSMVMRLGVLHQDGAEQAKKRANVALEADLGTELKNLSPASEKNLLKAENEDFEQLIGNLRTIIGKYHLRLELVTYENSGELQQALLNKDVHGICEPKLDSDRSCNQPLYHTVTRISRLYEIINAELAVPFTSLTYVNLSESKENH